MYVFFMDEDRAGSDISCPPLSLTLSPSPSPSPPRTSPVRQGVTEKGAHIPGSLGSEPEARSLPLHCRTPPVCVGVFLCECECVCVHVS